MSDGQFVSQRSNDDGSLGTIGVGRCADMGPWRTWMLLSFGVLFNIYALVNDDPSWRLVRGVSQKRALTNLGAAARMLYCRK